MLPKFKIVNYKYIDFQEGAPVFRKENGDRPETCLDSVLEKIEFAFYRTTEALISILHFFFV